MMKIKTWTARTSCLIACLLTLNIILMPAAAIAETADRNTSGDKGSNGIINDVGSPGNPGGIGDSGVGMAGSDTDRAGINSPGSSADIADTGDLNNFDTGAIGKIEDIGGTCSGEVENVEIGGGEEAGSTDVYALEAEDANTESGNSYATEITPNGVVGTGVLTEFKATFKEVGDNQIGSANIELPVGFSIAGGDLEPEAFSFITSNDRKPVWKGNISGLSIYLQALTDDENNFIRSGESISVVFRAKTPDVEGVYNLETAAWSDIDGTVKNQPAGDNPYNGLVYNYHDILPVTVSESVQGVIDLLPDTVTVPGAGGPQVVPAPGVYDTDGNRLDSDIIHVHPGDYNENIVIDKPLALVGLEGSGQTRVFASDKNSPVLLVQGEDIKLLQGVIVEGFTFSGENIVTDSNYYAGIRINHAHEGIFNDILATRIGAPAGGNIYGVYIYGGGNHKFTDVTVDGMEGIFNWGLQLNNTENNQFNKIKIINLNASTQSFGIYMTSGSQGNYFDDTTVSSLNSMIPIAVYLRESHANQFKQTQIENIEGSLQAAGILLTIGSSGNMFFDTSVEDIISTDGFGGISTVGIHTSGSAGDNNQINRAQISGLQGTELLIGFSLQAPNTKFEEVNVDFSGSTGSDNTRGAHIGALGTGLIQKSNIKNAYVAINTNSNSPGSITIIDNNLAGNTYGIINHNMNGYVDARYNYWGGAGGPATHPDDLARLGDFISDPLTGRAADGTGSAVSENVLFNPCWSDETMNQSCEGGTIPDLPAGGGSSSINIPGFTIPSIPIPPLPELLVISHEETLTELYYLVIPWYDYDYPDQKERVVTVDFVLEGSAADLEVVAGLYEELRQYFDDNHQLFSDSVYAAALLDLSVSWAAILTVEAVLLSADADLAETTAAEAVSEAEALLDNYSEYLVEEQEQVLREVLSAVTDKLD